MNDTVTDALDLVHVLDDADFRIGAGQIFDDDLGRDGVVRHRDIDLQLFAVFTLTVLDAPVDADALANALRKDGFGRGVEELILQGRGTGVDN